MASEMTKIATYIAVSSADIDISPSLNKLVVQNSKNTLIVSLMSASCVEIEKCHIFIHRNNWHRYVDIDFNLMHNKDKLSIEWFEKIKAAIDCFKHANLENNTANAFMSNYLFVQISSNNS
jgi:hypothetical protein